MNKELMFSSKKTDWETPQSFFDELDNEFHFTLDPCSNEQNYKCKKHYTEKENGLLQDWSGETVYVNPPYGSEIGKWVKKAFKESLKDNTTVVMLIPARTDTKWFHEYVYHHSEIRYIKGRLKFVGADYPAPFPSMVVVYR